MSKKFHYSQELCVRSVGKAMQHTGMIYPNAKIGVAVSGGVDSFVLLKVMQIRQRILPFPFEFMAIHINEGFDPTNHAPLEEWLEKENIKGHIEITDHGPRAHTDENRTKSPCFFCARLRRKRLFEICGEHGLTHLAFGHNADDLVSTFLLNLVQAGRVDGMRMTDSFFGGTLQVIRPLLMVDKPHIKKAAKLWELPIFSNPCPSAGITKRSDLLEKLDVLCKDSKTGKRNVYQALIRWQYDKHLVAPEDMITPKTYIDELRRKSEENKQNSIE